MRSLRLSGAALLFVLLVSLLRGCGSEAASPVNSSAPATAGNGSAGVSGAMNNEAGGSGGTSGKKGKAGSGGSAPVAKDKNGCPIVPNPPSIPPDWEAFTDWSCDCRYYVPGAKGQMPEPIAWEPCPPPAPQNVACLQIVQSWPHKGAGVGDFAYLSQDPETGKQLLLFLKLMGDYGSITQSVIAETDGPVRFAFMPAHNELKGCRIWPHHLKDGKFSLGAVGDSTEKHAEGVEGVVAGDVRRPDELKVLKFPQHLNTSHWFTSEQWLVRWLGKPTVFSWDLKTTFNAFDSDLSEVGLVDSIFVHKGDVFTSTGGVFSGSAVVWNQAQGQKTLVYDPQKVVTDFAADGKDMVWSSLEGPDPDNLGVYAKQEVWTAPYTTNPEKAKATARRVRSSLFARNTKPWIVGCGYAASDFYGDVGTYHSLWIVRLSDGYSWLLKGMIPESLSWGRAIELTCDEIFATTTINNSSTIVRIRLDSLGPGTPPD